jgi:hypothetical protein
MEKHNIIDTSSTNQPCAARSGKTSHFDKNGRWRSGLSSDQPAQSLRAE